MSHGGKTLMFAKITQLVALLGAELPPHVDDVGLALDHDTSCSASCASLNEEAIDELLDSLPSAESYNAALARRASSGNFFQDVEEKEKKSSLKRSASRASFIQDMSDAKHEMTAKENETPVATLKSFFSEAPFGGQICTFPSLILPNHFHEHECDRSKKISRTKNDGESENSRQQLEDLAVRFLSRDLSVQPSLSNDVKGIARESPKKRKALNDLPESIDISRVPQMILFNARETFIQLLDSRLRAYSNMLLLHLTRLLASKESGQDVELKERLVTAAKNKLGSLLDIRNQIALGTSVSSFRLREEPTEVQKSLSWLDKAEPFRIVKAPIVMETVIDLDVNESTTISFSADGDIVAYFDLEEQERSTLITKMDLTLDCRVLLTNMMESARRVAQRIVDCVSARCESINGINPKNSESEPTSSASSSAGPNLKGAKRGRAVSVDELVVGALLHLKKEEEDKK